MLLEDPIGSSAKNTSTKRRELKCHFKEQQRQGKLANNTEGYYRLAKTKAVQMGLNNDLLKRKG